MRWTQKQIAVAKNAEVWADELEAALLTDLVLAAGAKARKANPKYVHHYYTALAYGGKLTTAEPMCGSKVADVARDLDLSLTVAREAVRQSRVARDREKNRTQQPTVYLCDRLAAFKRRRAGAKKGSETRHYRKLRSRLSPAVLAACVESVSSECSVCEGHGLVYSPKWERDIKCYSCRGEGCYWNRQESQAAVLAAVAALEAEKNESEQIEAAKNNCNKKEEWDGTLTSTWQRNGEIDSEQAAKIRESAKRRHEETEYDSLLDSGVDKDTARDMIRGE